MIYVFGDYALDTGRHELRHAGVPCPLEPQVYDVLLYLILNRDRVVPKQELLDHVWAETFVSEAALYQRLGAARQAVGDSGRTQRVIKTVPKQGYCFSLAVEERDAEAHRSETSDRLAVDALETPPSVATSLPTHRTPIEERKLVTVLCGTLTNAAALAEQVGFEGLGRLRQMFFNLVAAEVQPYEGHLQPFGDDGFLVLFGVRPAQEDHARRAVLAALSLLQRFQESVLDAGTRQQVGLMVRLGGHTGQVMVERRDHTSQELSTAGGATTDLAVRLQTMAGPWQLLISDSMLRLVHGEVRSKRFGPVPVSNQPIPIMAYTVQSLGPWRPFMGQGGGRTLSRFVGRNRELAVLQALCAQAEAGQGQVVGVMGEPGMGKSRLLYEFVQQVDDRPGTYVEGHCLSYGTNTPYLPVLDVLRRLCGITDTDGSDAVSHKVHKTLSDDLKQGVPYVFQLLGLTAGTEALSQLTSQMVKKRTFDVLRQLILQRCRQSPLILAVENLHWIDPTSEAWLASLVEHLAQNSLLLLTTYRPGYRPRWMDKSYATQLSLSRLSLEDCMTIVQSVSQTEPLPDTLVQTILSKATGNPFFLEEIIYYPQSG
jgi:DNA-binding winged helix-turn-helix (wHTH) protein